MGISDFFSGVGSFFSGIGSALNEGLKTMVDGLTGIAKTIGDSIKAMCETLGSEGLALIGCIAISLIIPGFGLPEIITLIQLVGEVAKFLNIGGEDSPEELGMKAEIAECKPEDFDKIEEYIKYLNEEVTLDKGAVENLSEIDKVKYGAMGAALNIKAIEEKYNINMSPDFLRDVTIMKLSGEEVASYVESFKDNGINKMQDMTDYLRGKPIETEKSVVSESMLDVMKNLYPEKNSEQLESKLVSMQDELSEYKL